MDWNDLFLYSLYVFGSILEPLLLQKWCFGPIVGPKLRVGVPELTNLISFILNGIISLQLVGAIYRYTVLKCL